MIDRDIIKHQASFINNLLQYFLQGYGFNFISYINMDWQGN